MKVDVIILVPQPEVDQACEESEVALERAQSWTPRLHQGCAFKTIDDDIMLWQVLKRPRLGEKKMAATMKNIVFKSVLV